MKKYIEQILALCLSLTCIISNAQILISEDAGEARGVLDLNNRTNPKNLGLVLPAVTVNDEPAALGTILYDNEKNCIKYSDSDGVLSDCLLSSIGVGRVSNEVLGIGSKFQIKQASAGNNTTLVIGAHDEAVYSVGSTSSYNTGLGTTNPVKFFTLFFAEPTASVSLSSTHGILATKTGYVYAWGSNTNGRIGMGSVANVGLPSLVAGFGPEEEEDNPYYGKAIQVASSGANSYILTEDGRVFSMGAATTYGLNGDGLTSGNVTTPKEITFFSSITPKITQISASEFTAGASNGTNKIYVWGAGAYSALGTGKNTVEPAPKEVTFLKDIKQIAMGYRAGLALVEDGKSFYVWGAKANISLGNSSYQSTPIELGLPFPELGLPFPEFDPATDEILSVEASRIPYSSTATEGGIMITTTAGIFVSGTNRTGRLGTGNTDNISSGFGILSTVNIPADTKFLRASLGVGHSIIVTGYKDGSGEEVYTDGFGVGAASYRPFGSPYIETQHHPVVLYK
ncbi:MAG: hypothetical protein LBQ84_02795 [Flavobacteriaceae bacterium]|jgi:alpha-tubulin suppressor-like RCC1 family protein|nr:hypothetical protein [Flavobacteriaceae bacterium]